MSNLPTVAWQTVVNNVAVVNSTTYTLSIANINPNDPGASSNTVAVGYYIRDWIGHTYSITGINVGGDPLRIQVVDDFLVGIGPQQGRLAYVYKSVGGGMAPYVAPIRYERLDESAIGYGLPIDLDVLWSNSELKATQNPGICAETPIGIQDISINYSTRIVTITPPLGYFHYFTDGNGIITKHEVVGPISFPAFTNTTGTWYFYFDNNGNAVSTQLPWTDFSLIVTVLRIVWDNTKTPDSAKALTIFSEYHLNDISAIDHAWKHRYGSVWFNGLDIFSNFLPSPGIPNADGRNTVVGLSSGTMLDDNLPFSITNTPTPATFWQQDLGSNTIAVLNATNSGIFKVRYKGGAGAGVVENGTRFPFLWDIATNKPQYVDNAGVKTPVSNGYFFVYFMYGIQDGRVENTIRITPAYSEYANATDANAVTWETVQTQDEAARDTEIRPLYKLVFETKNSFSIGCKYTVLRTVTDIRKSVVTQTTSSIGSILASNVVYTPFTGISSTNVQTLGLELYNKFQGTLNTLPKYNATGITDSKFTDDGTTPKYNTNTIWHAGISNLPTVDWTAKDLSLYGDALSQLTKSHFFYTSNFGIGTPDSDGLQIFTGDVIRFGKRNTGVFTEWARFNNAGDFKIASLSGYLKGTSGIVGAVSSIPESDISFTDITTGNVSTLKHGYIPKLSGSATDVFKGDGTWGSGGGGTAGGSNTQLQYNNSSAFGGISGLTYDNVNLLLGEGIPFKKRDITVTPTAPLITGTVTSSTSNSITDTTKTLVVNDYIGYIVYAGTGYGDMYVGIIESNTVNSFTVNGFSIQPPAGKSYKILPYKNITNSELGSVISVVKNTYDYAIKLPSISAAYNRCEVSINFDSAVTSGPMLIIIPSDFDTYISDWYTVDNKYKAIPPYMTSGVLKLRSHNHSVKHWDIESFHITSYT